VRLGLQLNRQQLGKSANIQSYFFQSIAIENAGIIINSSAVDFLDDHGRRITS